MFANRRIRDIGKHWQLYLFLVLPMAYLLLFAYAPMAGVQVAFKKYTYRLGILGSPWVGLENFIKFFKSYQFGRLVGNTFRLSFYSLAASFPLPILFALMLHSMRGRHLKKMMQTLTSLPHFISVVVVVGMINQLLNPRIGLYGKLYGLFYPGQYPIDLLANPNAFPHMYILSGIWQSFGWNSIIYMAALSAVSEELHEAAMIDGATRLRRIIHIDVPAILPTITIMLILRMGRMASIGFEKAYLMQNPLNLRASEIISTYVYKIGMTTTQGPTDVGYATAIDMFNSVINMVLIVLMNFISKRVGETSLW